MTNYLSESVGVFLYIGRGTLQMLFSPKYVVKINKKTFQNSLTSVAGRSTHQRFLEQSSSKFYVLRYVVRHQFLVTTSFSQYILLGTKIRPFTSVRPLMSRARESVAA